MTDTAALLKNCMLCPRRCGVDRTAGERGFCGESAEITAARAALHFWEEPCISGLSGSGAVFFCGCGLQCVYCQNYEIARGGRRRGITGARLAEIFLELQAQGAANINLVTPTHFVPLLIPVLERIKQEGLRIPIVYNSSGYETAETIKRLDGLIDIYLPDCKYRSSARSKRYSQAPDYFAHCTDALSEMIRQTGAPRFFPAGVHPGMPGADREEGLLDAVAYNALAVQGEAQDDYTGPYLRRGTIVRHLALPGGLEDSKRILRYLFETFGDGIYLSVMNQYTPSAPACAKSYPELAKGLPAPEYDALIEYCIRLGVENAFFQEGETARESFVPLFDGTGL